MANPADVKLLLVEDMEDMRNILRRLLGAMGFTKITMARNGEEAWSLMQSQRPDLVLCDWNMPKMSGRQLLNAVRADPQLSLIPFVMITGENAATQVKSAVSGGVTDFIVKPFTAALLEQRLLQVLETAPLLSDPPPQA
ncbi:MAG: response regulator [Rhodoferax sp.]|nr:response regulator [Rhodoferax sp.]